MKSHTLQLLFLLLSTLSIHAQRVSGTIVDTLGTPIPYAIIAEMDGEHRVLNSTSATKSGQFTMKISGRESARLRISAPGYRTLTWRIEPRQALTFTLSPKPPSHLQQLRRIHTRYQNNYVITSKLLCGRSGTREVPWHVMIEHLGDSTFVLRLPVKTESQLATYPEGRMAVIEGHDMRQTLLLQSAEDAHPIEGSPAETGTWKEFTRMDYRHVTRGTYDISYRDNEVYYYPPFILTRSQLQSLIDRPATFARLLIDNERANNYWIMYPLPSFPTELQKILKKFE